MAKLTLPNISSGYNSATAINEAFQLIEDHLNNKVLYRDNPVGEPNALESSIDFNNVDVNNVGTLDTDNITVAGNSLTGKVQEAADSATQASTSASEAATSASEALVSKNAAATSATNAAADALAVASTYDDFDDRYLGAKASAPTVDNDGDALSHGALYYDTTLNEIQVYTPSGWGGVSSQTTSDSAAAYASAAATSASEAAASEAAVDLAAQGVSANVTAAAGFASDASNAAAAAGTSETNAANSEANAATSESNILANISTATTKAAEAAASATAAATSASNASVSAGAASSQASIATSQATTATNAATSATAAQADVNAKYDSFDDRYLGAKSSAPTVDNDGDTLLTGALYWNTVQDSLYLWDGGGWNAAAFTADGSVTSFNTRTGAITLSAPDVTDALGYTPGTIVTQNADNVNITGGSLYGVTLTGLSDPVTSDGAATKNYVDNAVTGIHWKSAVNLLADSNVSLTGSTNTLVIDGHAALVTADAGYRILLKGQTTASENGIYVYNDDGANYTLSRSSDADTYQELQGASIFTLEGTTYGSTGWVQENYDTTDFTGQNWVQFSGSGTYTGIDGIQLIGNEFSLTDTGVTASSYGSTSKSLQATVDATGRITALADADISIANTQVTGLGTVSTENVVPVTKGGTGHTTLGGYRSALGVPLNDGTDATGTWGINITGNAATATTTTGNAATATSSTKIANSGSWNVEVSGTDLIFSYNGTNQAKIDSSGNLTVTGNVTAFGTV